MKARRHIHRGHVLASGLLLTRKARERALRLYGPGMRITEVQGGLALLFGEPVLLRSDGVQGHLLVPCHGHLCTAPLEADEVEGASGMLLVSAGGVVSLGDGKPVDPSDWIELGLEVLPVKSLGSPPPPPRVAPEAASDARTVFADLVGDASPEVSALLSSLGKGAQATGAFSTAAMSWMSGLRSLMGQGKEGGTGPNWMNELDGWLANQMAELGMGSMLGEAHSRFLEQLVRDFEQGQLDEALRRAIPLGGLGSLGASLAGLRSLGASRSNLGFSGAGGPSSVIPMAEALMEKLKELYRQALRQLEAQGRIDEAAFVLAELLNEPGEAVALLERHERWARAAELAEVKELSPDLAVRLWFLAKDVDRAILAARRRGGMEGALVRLEAQDKVAARRLRLVWAATLAATGRPGAAVDLLADVPGTEALVERWLDAAIEGGGPPGAKALRLALERRPEQWEPLYETAREWLDGPARPLQHLSAALCDCDHEVASPLVRHAARQLLRQRVRRGSDVDLDALLQRARKRGGGALGVDTPRDPVAVTPLLATRAETRVERFDAAGAAAPSAVRWLPRQRLLVARGESGLELRARDGRLLRRWEQPVHELAVHEAGTEAIGLGHRGAIRLLCRIDLTTFEGGFWTEANIQRFMPTYSDPWVVSGDRELMAIDVADRGFRRTWRVSTDGPVEALSMGAMLSYLADGEVWVRRMPDLALHARSLDPATQVLGMAKPELHGLSNGEREFILRHAHGWRWQGPHGSGLEVSSQVLGFTSSPRWTALATEGEVVLAVRNQSAVRLRLELPGGRPRMFLDDDHLVVWDDLGRLVVAELVHGDIVCDLRI